MKKILFTLMLSLSMVTLTGCLKGCSKNNEADGGKEIKAEEGKKEEAPKTEESKEGKKEEVEGKKEGDASDVKKGGDALEKASTEEKSKEDNKKDSEGKDGGQKEAGLDDLFGSKSDEETKKFI